MVTVKKLTYEILLPLLGKEIAYDNGRTIATGRLLIFAKSDSCDTMYIGFPTFPTDKSERDGAITNIKSQLNNLTDVRRCVCINTFVQWDCQTFGARMAL